MIRLNKYLADCGIAARRKCDELIQSGQVSVNGIVEQRLGIKVDERVDHVMFQSRLVTPVNQFKYILLNKPKGVVTTASDERGRKAVFDVVRVKTRVFPVGRLDRDTSGLLLLTNDGDLAYKITHPKYEIEKRYRVRLDRPLDEAARTKLEQGIQLEEGVTSPGQIIFPEPSCRLTLTISIHQGWKRQIRRMFESVGYEVRQLHRNQLASLSLLGTRPGQWRYLSSMELTTLKRIVHGNKR